MEAKEHIIALECYDAALQLIDAELGLRPNRLKEHPSIEIDGIVGYVLEAYEGEQDKERLANVRNILGKRKFKEMRDYAIRQSEIKRRYDSRSS